MPPPTIVGTPPFRYRVDENLPANSRARAAPAKRSALPAIRRSRLRLPARPAADSGFRARWRLLHRRLGRRRFRSGRTASSSGRMTRVYCTDDFGHAVHAFAPNGERLASALGSGKPSDTGATSIDYRTIKQPAGPFNYPCNLALGPTGEMFVADGYGNARRASLCAGWQADPVVGRAGGGAGAVSCRAWHRRRCRSASFMCATARMIASSFFLQAATISANGSDLARPCQLFIDKAGWFYVAELGYRAGRWPGTGAPQPGQTGGRVSIFDKQGKRHAPGVAANSCAPGDFFAPHDVWVDSHGDLYVSEVSLSGGGRAGVVPGSCHSFQKFVRK